MNGLKSYIIVISASFMFFACEKTKTYEDKFDVSITEATNVPGGKIAYQTPDNVFSFLYAPAGTITKSAVFSESEYGDLWVGETEVTYKLYKEIYSWAVNNGYENLGEGQPGSDVTFPANHPVTRVCWCDALVWCNALTEYYNLHNGDKPDYTFAYTYNGSILKNAGLSSAESEDVVYDEYATGFRIPTNAEWYGAAAYKSTPEDYACGASANYKDDKANSVVAWYRRNSDMHSHPVAEKLPSLLGLYDMSGNVSEIMFDRRAFNNSHYNIKGGAWNSNPEEIQIGEHHPIDARTSSYALGFRLFRTQGGDDHAQIDNVENETLVENEPGSGNGTLSFNGITYTITKAVLFNMNTIGSPLIELELFSDDISLKKENNGGYTGTGTITEFSINTTDEFLKDGVSYTDNEILLMTVSTNCNTDVFPWTYQNMFVGGSASEISVNVSENMYTITFKCSGTALPAGNDTELTGSYTGSVQVLDAGIDY